MQMVLSERRDDTDHTAGLLAWQCCMQRSDIIWDEDVRQPRLDPVIEASLRAALHD